MPGPNTGETPQEISRRDHEFDELLRRAADAAQESNTSEPARRGPDQSGRGPHSTG